MQIKPRHTAWALLLIACSFFPLTLSAQSAPAGASTLSRFGVMAKASSLGFGGEAAFQLTHRINLRAGFNDFSISHTFSQDGVSYAAQLTMRSMTANADIYLLGPLHISPGALLYNGFKVAATAAVPAGSTFTLGGVNYESGAANPLNGTMALTVPKAAPELLIGFGNPVPRSGRHITFDFDMGVVLQGSLTSALNLGGLACIPPNSSGATCKNAGTDPTVQSNVVAQQTKLNNDLKVFKYYPVVSFGIGYRF